MRVLWVHGLEGSPTGKKPTAIRAAGHDVVAPSFSKQTLAERVDTLRAALAAEPGPVVLAGSSYGGLTSAIVAPAFVDRLMGLLLCAPALAFKEAPVERVDQHVPPPGIETIVIHGVDDPICPIDASRAYVARAPARSVLWEVADGHRLEGSLDRIVAAVAQLSAEQSRA